MKITLVTILALTMATAQPNGQQPLPLSPIHMRDIFCVAAFAIVASEQEQGMENVRQYPVLSERGRTYAGNVGSRVLTETGQTREQVRDEILRAVTRLQQRASVEGDADAIIATAMSECLPLLDKEVPAPPKPDIVQCAVLMQGAYETVYAREGLSKKAQDLKTLAFVLDSRAREQLRAEGKSGNESDQILIEVRDQMKAADKINGAETTLDTDHCFALAAPKKKDGASDH